MRSGQKFAGYPLGFCQACVAFDEPEPVILCKELVAGEARVEDGSLLWSLCHSAFPKRPFLGHFTGDRCNVDSWAQTSKRIYKNHII